MKRRIMKSLVVAGALGLAVTACGSSGSPNSPGAQGKPLVVVNNAGQVFTRSFNPYVSTSLGNANSSTALVYEPLLMFNLMRPTQPPIPWLATSYAWSNGGKTLTFTIRRGVKFSDGKPLTAADVAFSFNLIKNNPTLSPATPPPSPTSATAPNASFLSVPMRRMASSDCLRVCGSRSLMICWLRWVCCCTASIATVRR